MSLSAVVRFAPVLETDQLLDPDTVKPDQTMYRRGSLWLLPPLSPDPPGVPLLVDHKWGQRVGTVHEIRSDWSTGSDGVWWAARATVDTPPAWLRARETRASFAFTMLQRQQIGNWELIHDAVVCEVSLPSPSRRPRNSRARVELLYDPDSNPGPGAGAQVSRVPGTLKRPPLYVGVPTIPDDAPEEVKDALALANATAVEGQCPACHATPEFTGHVELGVMTITFLHDPGCPVAELLNPSDP
jgi:hypothetical protein